MKREFIFQNSKYKIRRKELRNNPTEAESKLWDYLKGSKLGYKFTRQYGVGPYVIDFYCPKLKLAIELDGLQHNKTEEVDYDNQRNNFLEHFGIKTIRFWNEEITKNINKVLDEIVIQASKLT